MTTTAAQSKPKPTPKPGKKLSRQEAQAKILKRYAKTFEKLAK